MTELELVKLKEALRPLANIWERYLNDGLDECRPEWMEGLDHDLGTPLYCGRGGRELLCLQDAKYAYEALANLGCL